MRPAFISTYIHKLSALKCVQNFFKGSGVILMLHRIAPFEAKLSPNENMKVSPEFLENFIVDCLDGGYHFISLDELIFGLLHKNLPKYFICISIDDGYKDNLTYGYPIFAKYDIPFCIYVCTSFPESSHNMWWFALEDHLLAHDSITLDGQTYNIATRALKENMFLTLRNEIIQKAQSYQSGTDILESFGITYDPSTYNHLALSWEDICFLDNVLGGGQKKLCTIGAHTHSHPIFNHLSPEDIAKDIHISQELFVKHLGYAPKHFAYPFGGRAEVDASYFALIKELGFLSATTTRHGCIYPAHKKALHALPRVFFGQDFMLESAFRVRKKRIVTA